MKSWITEYATFNLRNCYHVRNASTVTGQNVIVWIKYWGTTVPSEESGDAVPLVFDIFCCQCTIAWYMQICLFGHWSDVPYRDVTCWLILITSTSTAVCDDDDDDDDDDISAHLYCIWSTTQWSCYAANRACTNCEGSTSGCKVVWCPNVQSFQTCKLEESLEMLSRCTQQTYLGRGGEPLRRPLT